MTQEERIEKAAEAKYKTVPEKTKWICKDSFKDGWKTCIETDEFKNLYAEGLEVGMNLYKPNAQKWNRVADVMRNLMGDKNWEEDSIRQEEMNLIAEVALKEFGWL